MTESFLPKPNKPDLPPEWSDIDVEWVFDAITRNGDFRVISVDEMERTKSLNEDSEQDPSSPSLEEIYMYLVGTGASIAEIEAIHGLKMDQTGAVFEVRDDYDDEDEDNRTYEGVFE